ncbi:MAG: immunoglobulin domain-containing protein [Opitutaceae bacterium]|nr:immunoglobulin domain-containing protein [Opitutaceae bacterium]
MNLTRSSHRMNWIVFAVVLITQVCRGETTLVLMTRTATTGLSDARVTVPAGETVRVQSPYAGPAHVWFKDDKVIPGATQPTLVLPAVSAGDAGVYRSMINDPLALVVPSQSLHLAVGPVARFVNTSTRALVGQGQEVLVGGFVVTGPASKKVILRVVGPSLRSFGVDRPLADPVLRLYDAQGKLYTGGYAYPAIVGGPTYESDLAGSLLSVGAFPLPAGSKDVVELRPFPAGSYTAVVSSASGGSGVVLFEVYEVP